MAYKTCPDCGTKLGSFGCPNCNEHDYISMQDCYTPAPMHQSNHTPEQRGVDVHDQLAYIIDDLSKAHDLLARTYLTNEKYNPISNILAKSKLSLADVLIKLSAILLPSKGQEGEAERIHELKTWSKYFEEVFMGRKSFEVRKNDRDFKVGDILTLVEGDLWGDYPEGKRWFPTGRKLSRRVTHILPGGQFGIEEGYCVMSIA